MPGKNKQPRQLWLHIKAKTPRGTSNKDVARTLMESISRGDYIYPSDWRVILMWRNDEYAPMKQGEFTAEMRKSASSSQGWDTVVYDYLRSKA